MKIPFNINIAGLPDGIFSNQTIQFGKILEGLAMEDVDKSYGYLIYFAAIWYICWLFGIFFPIWYVVTSKIWQPR
jgi:hypothetical protein